MKKNNKIKKSVSVLAFLFVCALSVILSSCSDELDIQQSYPFKVETMPVPKDIVRGQTVEIRCELKAEGKFDGTIYTIRYFQHDGKGSLRMENGVPAKRPLSVGEREVPSLLHLGKYGDTDADSGGRGQLRQVIRNGVQLQRY